MTDTDTIWWNEWSAVSVVISIESIRSYVHRVPIVNGTRGPEEVATGPRSGVTGLSAGVEQLEAMATTAVIVARHPKPSVRLRLDATGTVVTLDL